MQQLCISKDFNLYHIYQNKENVSATVGEMSATVGKLNML